MIKVDWIASKNQIERILTEYCYLIRRFPQWFSLLIGRFEDQQIRQLLLPNLVDEAGRYLEEPSHQDHLLSLIKSLNINLSKYEISGPTKEIEKWFYELFYSGDLYKCLCVLGPGTESVSYQFLNPLEESIKKNFVDFKVDYTYFEIHRPEIEVKHAEDIANAIAIYEKTHFVDSVFTDLKNSFIKEGIEKHQQFWDNMRIVTINL